MYYTTRKQKKPQNTKQKTQVHSPDSVPTTSKVMLSKSSLSLLSVSMHVISVDCVYRMSFISFTYAARAASLSSVIRSTLRADNFTPGLLQKEENDSAVRTHNETMRHEELFYDTNVYSNIFYFGTNKKKSKHTCIACFAEFLHSGTGTQTVALDAVPDTHLSRGNIHKRTTPLLKKTPKLTLNDEAKEYSVIIKFTFRYGRSWR